MRLEKLATLVLGVSLTFLLPFSAMGAERRDYIRGKGGIYSPSGDLDDLHFDMGFSGEIAWGHYLSPNFAVEIGVGYFNSEDVRVVPLIATGKAIYPRGKWELFAQLGGGAYFAKLDGVLIDPSLGTLTIDDHEVLLGGFLGVGVNYKVTEELFLGIEGRYLLTGEGDFGGVKTDLNGFMVMGAFGFRF